MNRMSDRRFVPMLALLAAVTVMALTGPVAAEEIPDETVSEIRDDRIQESSGLALSMKHDDLVYTMNDEGGPDAKVYAVQVSTGEVVGVTDIGDLPIQDPESIAVDAGGTLWLGDLGDNERGRDDVAIYTFAEPGPGQRTASGVNRYRVVFPGGPQNVEGLMVRPQTNEVYVVSKSGEGTGRIFQLPDLEPGGTVQAKDVGEAPEAVTDATFTQSGKWALLRTEDDLWVYNPDTWQAIGRIETPELDQGESVTVERGDRTVLLGSEGTNSPIVRVALPDQPEPAQPGDSDSAASGTVDVNLGVAVLVGLGAVVMLIAGVLARRRLKI